MQDERIRDVAEEEAKWDHAVLQLLAGESGPWSIDEVIREIGDRFAAEDAISRLYGAGLLHRLESFVFATRAGISACRLFCLQG